MLCMASLLFADSDRRAVDKIWTVVKNEFRRVKDPVKPASWQIYDSVHDARIGQNIAQKLKREFRIFEPTSPRMELSEAEKEMIKKALDRHNGKRKLAAKDLDISERTLYRKIKQLGLE